MKLPIGLWVVFCVLLGGLTVFAQTKEDYYRNGYVYFSQGDYAKALDSYQKALEVDPQFVDARYWLGKTLEKMGRLEEAVKEWRMVLIVAPRHRDAFQKWRAYALSLVQDGAALEKYKRLFLGGSSALNISREEAWSSLIPFALLLSQRSDFSSLYLATRCLQWAGEKVSSLLVPYEEKAFQKALESISREDWERDPKLVYQFLKEVTSRFGGKAGWQDYLKKAFESLFVYQVGEASRQGTKGVVFTLREGEVEREALDGGNTEEPTAFFIKE